MTYNAAEANCRSMGATLTQQFSDDDLLNEDFFTMDEAAGQDGLDLGLGRLWLGMNDMDTGRSLRWSLWNGFISAANVAYSRWAPGQPAGSVLGARCISLTAKNEWMSTFCNALLKSACQMPACRSILVKAETFVLDGYDIPFNRQGMLHSYSSTLMASQEVLFIFIFLGSLPLGNWVVKLDSYPSCGLHTWVYV